MKQSALRLAVAAALLSPASLYALGLGDVHLNSALNQTFDASIDLISAMPDELSTLQVGLANQETFQRYGLDRPDFLSTFSLRLDNRQPARPVIRVSSSSVVNEPFVNLLVEINWSGGKLLREYTLFLDPPTFQSARSEASVVQSPQVGVATSNTVPVAHSARSSESVAPASSMVSSIAQTASTYKVKAADSLSKIATELTDVSRVTVNQSMVALYRANPHAFSGNMNVLRVGSVLRVPGLEEITTISNAQAQTEIDRQQSVWRTSSESSSASSVGSETTIPATPVSEHLRLVPAEQSAGAETVTAGAVKPDATLDSANERIQKLEADLAEVKRLLDLKNAELAQLQQQLGGMTPDAVTPKAQVSTSPSPWADVWPKLAENTLWLITAALGLIVAVLIFLRRRQQAEITADFDAIDQAKKTSLSEYEDSPSAADDTVHAHQGEDDSKQVLSSKANDDGSFTPQTQSDTRTNRVAGNGIEQHDVVAEADFHLSYGLYDQAADIIKLALELQPQRQDLKLKLADIYFAWGNKDAFVDVAQALSASQSLLPVGEWDKVLNMGKQLCPDYPLFASGVDKVADVDLSAPLSQPVPTAVPLHTTSDHDEINLLLEEDATQQGALDTLLTEQLASVSDPVGMSTEYKADHQDSVELEFQLDDMQLGQDQDADVDHLQESALEEPQPLNTERSAQTNSFTDIDDLLQQADNYSLYDEETDSLPDDATDESISSNDVATKLDLARAYVDMGDLESARSMLQQVLEEGTAEQKRDAQRLLSSAS